MWTTMVILLQCKVLLQNLGSQHPSWTPLDTHTRSRHRTGPTRVDWFSKFCRCQSGQASAGSNGTRSIHGGPTRQHTGPKRSATNILVSDTTGHPSNDHALTAQSCFGCKRGTCIILTRWFKCCSWLVYNPNYWHWQVSSYSFRLSLYLYGQNI